MKTLRSCARILRRHHWALRALACVCFTASAQATMTTIKFQPNSADIFPEPTGSSPVTILNDAFGNVHYHSHSKGPSKVGFAGTFLTNSAHTNTDIDYAFNSATNQLQRLTAYIGPGSDIALGLDAGRHFFGNGAKFPMTLTPVPEMEAIYPIISLFAAIVFTRVLRRQRTAQLKVRVSAER